jgi:hypothetical protein
VYQEVGADCRRLPGKSNVTNLRYDRGNFMAERAVTLVAAAVLAAWPVSRPLAAPSRTDEIVGRAVQYVSDFVHRFSSIVAEEHFVQDARRVSAARAKGANPKELAGSGETIHRELVSDYLLVKSPGAAEWQIFRDVFEVDGRPVRERTERLTQLFLEPAADTRSRASEIERDGARYNLGDPVRTLANPLLPLGFLQQRYQSRFKFSLRESDPSVGPDVWIVEYREQARPTIIRRVPDGDLPARGRFWIEFQTGRVLKTELSVSEIDDITTSYGFDERFQIALPTEMREAYWYGGAYVVGHATYGRFRQFGVKTEERLK